MAVGPAAAAASRPTTRTTSRQCDHEHHDALLCIGTAHQPRRPEALPLRRPGLLREGRRRDGGGLPRPSRPPSRTRSRSPSAATSRSTDRARYHMPEFQVPAGTTREEVLERAGLGAGCARGSASRRTSRSRRSTREYGERMEHELGVIQSMGFAGYFLIVADFIGYARKQRHPGRARAAAPSAGSARRRGRLGITGVDPIEYDIIFERFLNPERISHARHRRRLLHARARRGDPLRRREVRRRGRRRPARRADHHVRDAPGARRDPRRRPRARHAVRRRRPHREAVPETLGITLDEALEQSPELRARIDADGQVAQAVRDRAQARGPDAPRVDARRRRRDRHRAADRDGAALPRREVGRRDDAVRHALRREDRADQVRLPRPAHADHDRRRRAPHPRGRPPGLRRSRRSRSTTRRPTSCSCARRHRGRVPGRVGGHDRPRR